MNNPIAPRIRYACRALVVHERREILLMQIGIPDNSWRVWIAPGGGIAEGEDPARALQRELFEELGLRVEADFGPCVWTRRHVFEWEGEWIDQREAFYFLPVEKFEATAIHQPDAMEKKYFKALRWWTLDEIRVSSDEFVPRKLIEHLDELLRLERLPETPLEVGI